MRTYLIGTCVFFSLKWKCKDDFYYINFSRENEIIQFKVGIINICNLSHQVLFLNNHSHGLVYSSLLLDPSNLYGALNLLFGKGKKKILLPFFFF